MARANLNQTSFTGGVLSPRVLGRVDIERYFQALKSASNGYAVPQGGFRRRPGLRYTLGGYSDTNESSILVPFVVGRDLAYMLEIGGGQIRIIDKTGAVVHTITGTPYAAPILGEMDFAQSDRTMWIFHSFYPTARLQLLGTGSWAYGNAPFTQTPFAEIGILGDLFTTISSAAVGAGRTVTTAGAMFQPSDVGRAVIFEAGIAVVTGYTSATQATVEVTRAFPSTTLGQGWILEGSPQTTVTASAKDPVGATITLTTAAGAWRTGDVGAMVRVNGGLCKITGIASATVANAKIVRELSSTVTAPALAWSLEHPVWGDEYGYPRTGTIYQQRLIVGGTKKFPRTIWGSRIGEPLDFELGTTDDLAFSFTIDSDEASAITFISSNPALVVLTQSGEYSMRGGVEKPITPTNVRIQQESNHGAAQVRPVFAAGESLFVQRAGRKIRSMSYRYDMDRYASPDITALSEHLTKAGVKCMTWQQEPDPLLWAVMNDGSFISCTLDRDQQPSIVGWFPHATNGFVEWAATMPIGDRDEVWMMVRRGAKRYIERMDDTVQALQGVADSPVYGMTVDCGAVFSSGTATASYSVPHLEGYTVAIVADGLVMPSQLVPAGGALTLPRTAKQVQIGLAFSTVAELLTPEMGTQAGTAQGTAQRSGRLFLRFLDTINAKVRNDEGGEEVVAFQQFGDSLLDQAPTPFTGFHEITKLGWARGRSELSIVQDLPLPMHLLSVTRRHTANEG
jgi:hypothetical protein